MAKQFGMMLYIGLFPDDYDSYGPRNWRHCQDDWQYRQEKFGQAASNFYVHPDSLPLLEPRVGDVLYTRLSPGAVSVEEVQSEERQSVSNYLISRGARIIQRDGRPFFWPDCEAA